MHSFIPCVTAEEAQSLLDHLRASHIERYLKTLNVEGTCNWAQPGRISRFLQFAEESAPGACQLNLV